jgi:nucleoside-diphosphate-sugar epimerase
MIGGTGPSGVPIVTRLAARGHDVTILHRGTHERPETPADLDHIHADPYDEDSLTGALDGT